MNDFGFNEMQSLQKQLQEKYENKWGPVSPKKGKDMLLYLMIELGEAADIIKKDGNQKIIEDEAVRTHFIEEMADVMMYYNDVMLCYDISVDELSAIYHKKMQKNMDRW